MYMCGSILTFLLLLFSTLCTVVLAINHWKLNEDGRITQKVDSPFYMREPDNLLAFLDQIRYNEYVENSYLELLRQREQIVEHLRFSVQFGEDLVDQAKCAMDYYLMEKRMSFLELSSSYLKRLNLPEHMDLNGHNSADEPICSKVAHLMVGPCCYDHLESFQPDAINAAHVEREEDINIGAQLGGGLGRTGSGTPAADTVQRFALEGLRLDPQSWKFHTISSYYWRVRGHAQNALECARLGVMLAPRDHKDIPLLSLGIILFRSGYLADADVILSAAVEHAPNVSENHIALASALAMKHDFNRSLYHFDEAERLDPGLLPRTLPIRNFIVCLENLTKKTAKMYSYVEYMKNEVKEFKKLKSQISQSHDKLIQQQIPLGVRYMDAKENNDDLLKRGQYCSTRTLTTADEPMLFCDFYSDMQMRLESNDVDIDSLERDLKLSSEAVIKQVSTEFHKQLNFEQIKSTKAQIPASPKEKEVTIIGKKTKVT